MKTFSELGISYKPSDGKKRFPNKVTQLRQLVNIRIEVLDFEIQAINAEKATEIQQKAIKIENGNVSDIDVYKTKVLTIMEGCQMFKDKALREHFKAPTPKELINKLLLKGEVDDLVDAINNLSDLKKIEKAEDEIKN